MTSRTRLAFASKSKANHSSPPTSDLRGRFPIEASMFSILEASAFLQLSRSRVYELIASRELKTVMVGRRRLVPGTAIQKFIHALTSTKEAV